MSRPRCPACTAEPRRRHTDEELKTFHETAFLVQGEDWTVPVDEFYFNSKDRCRRMMLNSLTSDARRVYACLELGTMGFRQELAVYMVDKRLLPMSPSYICRQTQLPKQRVRRALEDLEIAGLADRRGNTKGKVEIYSWAIPREPKKQNGSRARLPFPDWFTSVIPEKHPFALLVKHLKYELLTDLGEARDYQLEKLEAAARDYQKAQKVAVETLKGVCAPRTKRKNERTPERTGDASSSSSPVPTTTTDPQPAARDQQWRERLAAQDAIKEEVIERSALKLDPALSEAAQISGALLDHCRVVDDWAVQQLIARPRTIVSDAPVAHIVHFIHAKWDACQHGRNPMAVLVTAVTECFRGQSYIEFARREAADSEREAAANRRAEERRQEVGDAPLDQDALRAEGIERMRRKLKGAP